MDRDAQPERLSLIVVDDDVLLPLESDAARVAQQIGRVIAYFQIEVPQVRNVISGDGPGRAADIGGKIDPVEAPRREAILNLHIRLEQQGSARTDPEGGFFRDVRPLDRSTDKKLQKVCAVKMPDLVDGEAVDEILLKVERSPVVLPPAALLIEMNRDHRTCQRAAYQGEP